MFKAETNLRRDSQSVQHVWYDLLSRSDAELEHDNDQVPKEE